MSYTELRREVAAAGLLKRSIWNYADLIAVTVALAVVSGWLVLYAEGWWRLLAIPALSLLWMQLGFLGHEAGHNAVFESSTRNRWLGYLCFPILLGMSFRPWVIRHNLHHAETNHADSDPDLENKLIAFTEEAAREKRGLARWIVRWQAYLFPFLAMFATIGFRIDAWRYVFTRSGLYFETGRYERERRGELAMLVVNLLLWIVLPSIVLGPAAWLPIWVGAQMLFGLHMVSAFAPNHKGMPEYDPKTMPTFLEAQVLTSRNVMGGRIFGPVLDWLYGGLNYQIEHHLFPTMPRNKLGRARRMVRAHCARIGLKHTEDNALEACRAIFAYLDDIGRTVAGPPPRFAPATADPAHR